MAAERPFRAAPHVAARAFEYRSGATIPPHAHGRHQLLYASRGVMTVHTPRGTWVVPPHRGVWIPARVRHWIEVSGALAMRTLYLRTDLARRSPGGCAVLNVPPLLRELILVAVARGGLDRSVARDRHLVEVLLDHLDAVAAAPFHLPEPRDPRAQRLAAHLRAAPGDRRPLAELARDAGASPRTLERLFHREVGLTVAGWRQQLRLVHALRLLGSGQAVTSVALDVGYDSPSAFIAAFRRVLGTTPARYFRTPDAPRPPAAAR